MLTNPTAIMLPMGVFYLLFLLRLASRLLSRVFGEKERTDEPLFSSLLTVPGSGLVAGLGIDVA